MSASAPIPSIVLVSVYTNQDMERFRSTMYYDYLVSLRISGIRTAHPIDKSTYIWGLTGSSAHRQLWNKINQGDYFVFFTAENYRLLCRVTNKEDSKLTAESLWGHVHLYAESFNLLIYFDRVDIVTIPIKQLSNIFNLELFSLIKKQNFLVVVDHKKTGNILREYASIEKALGLNLSGVDSPSTEFDFNFPPPKVRCNVTRFVRDTVKSIQLKIKYKYSCQICGYRITLNSHYYAEVHHIWPLAEGGVDDFDNMIVLCPTQIMQNLI